MIKNFPDTILLAAGLGTRMMPLTKDTPKPLIDVANKPLLSHVVDNFRAEGGTNFIVNAHYHAEKIISYAKEMSQKHSDITFGVSSEKEALLNSGGGAKKALRLTQSDPVFVANTDAFWVGDDHPLTRMAERFEVHHQVHPDAVVLMCAHPSKALGFRRSHDFCLNPKGEITFDSGAPVIYAGVALMGRRAFARTPNDTFSLNDLFERALEKNVLFGILLNADWYHVGDPEALAETQERLSAQNT